MKLQNWICLILIFIMIFILPITAQVTSVSQTLGTFQQDQSIQLLQICSNATAICDYCNITTVTNPNSTIILSNIAMTKRVSDFNYTSDLISSNLGRYLVNGYCGAGSQVMVWSYDYTITASGYDKPNTGEGLSLIGMFAIMVIVSGFFLMMAWMANNQVVKSMFIGLSAFILAAVVFFGMTATTQLLGGWSTFVTGYNTFFFFIELVIVVAVFAALILVFIKSLNSLKIRRGELDPENFQFEGRMG